MSTSVFLPLRRLLLLAVLCLSPALQAAQRLEVSLDGLDGELQQNTWAALALDREIRGGLTTAQVRERYEEARAAIARALQPFGYYRPDIVATLERPASPGAPWWAHYQVDPGPPLPVASVAVELEGPGGDDPELRALAGDLSLQPGAILDHRHYEASKRELLAGVQQQGYRDSTLARHRVEVDLEAYEARVRFQLDTGPRYVIGEISFSQDTFHTDYLKRYLVLEPGAPYDERALAAQRRLLSGSGYFREVEIEPQEPTGDETRAVPLRIRLQPYLANRYRGRLGWGTDTGFSAQLDWTRRYVGGRGQHFNLGLVLAEERRRLAGDVNYVIPLDPQAGSQVVLGLRHESKDLTYDEDVGLSVGGETRIATNLFSARWQRPERSLGSFELSSSVGASLVGETYDVFEVLFGHLPSSSTQDDFIDTFGPEAYDTLTPDFQALVPTLRLSLRRSDNPLFIRRGDYLDLQLLGASEALGSNIDFWQARFKSWHIRPLGAGGRLLARAEAGYSEADSREVLGVTFNQMPEYYEFRAGGVRSVRGYGYETLFPEDSITGGRHQLVASLEYEHEIVANWGLAAFVDAGNAFNNWEDYDAKVGVGLGLRWRSPVGLARVDVGIPLDDADDTFQIYITVGPEF